MDSAKPQKGMNPKETGIVLISIGISVFSIGMAFLMDRALMISGNLLIVVGVAFLARSRMLSLLHPNRLQGTLAFGMGVLFIMREFMAFGFVLEVLGLFLLLGDTIPTFRSVLKSLLLGNFRSLLS